MTRRGTATGWRNRIVGSGVQRADQFLGNPDNWRTHPSAQEYALTAVLDRVGWVQEVIVNRRTGHMIDGHLRVLAAMKRGDETPIPFKEVDLSPAEEALVLSVLDPLAALAGTDGAKLDELLGLLPDDDRAIAQLLHDERKATKRVEFDATERFAVIVDCEDRRQQAALRARLKAEGYACRTE